MVAFEYCCKATLVKCTCLFVMSMCVCVHACMPVCLYNVNAFMQISMSGYVHICAYLCVLYVTFVPVFCMYMCVCMSMSTRSFQIPRQDALE